jgi:hypothetical protein
VANGSVGAPAINFASSTNTGIFSPGGGAIALTSGGVLFLHNKSHSTALGLGALASNLGGISNVAVGGGALGSSNEGHFNVAVGDSALFSNTSGEGNTALGRNALRENTLGHGNVAIGFSAGGNAAASLNSIFIRNSGAAGDTATIKIGTQGTQTSAFIAGISGITTGVDDAIPVLIASNGQLGTTSSSRRYKEDIKPMGDMSAALMKLKPVTFRYQKPYADGAKPVQYGLIAEEVAEILPALAVFNKDGTPETVKYHLLPSFLLTGYQQQQGIIQAQAEQIATLEQRLRLIEVRLGRMAAR